MYYASICGSLRKFVPRVKRPLLADNRSASHGRPHLARRAKGEGLREISRGARRAARDFDGKIRLCHSRPRDRRAGSRFPAPSPFGVQSPRVRRAR